MPSLHDFIRLYDKSDCPNVYAAQVCRVVETQEVAATLQLVDDFDEQFLLEQLLDEVKPPYRAGSEHMHYLLKTPFRYPPLKYGSRFGSRQVASFFYAGETLEPTLGEVAYYRFVFLSHMQQAYAHSIKSQHMSFNLKVSSEHCADLSLADFAPVIQALTSPTSYHFSQTIGRWLSAEQGINLIRYPSARILGAMNVAIAQPSVIVSKQPLNQQNWWCLTQHDKVSFNQAGQGKPLSFYRDDFLVDGSLPLPA
ncbi:MAG: RES family NAD+ phosphorylase [Paraglaciecola sp.]|nr:RES family NAD+ phosphorylase [Paraglaciecola sp.]NCT47253.1 RES family NAD+ phosphorylase [Paraglaciecola sp.]